MFLDKKNLKWHGATVLGLILTVASIFLPIVNIKKNRIDLGSVIKLTGFSEIVIILYIISIMILILFSTSILSVKINENRGVLILRQFSGLLILGLLGIIIIESNQIIIKSEALKSQISFESGFYLLLLSAYFMIFGSVQLLKHNKPNYRFFAYSILLISVLLFLVLKGEYLGIVKEFIKENSRLKKEILVHISISFRSVLFASILGIPLGIVTWKSEKVRGTIFGVINSVQTIPSLALFGLLIAPLSILSNNFPILKAMGVKGIGETPALIALTLYALLPIVRNTYAGLGSISPEVVESGIGMGMSNKQAFFKIQIPLSLPVLFTGIKIAAIQSLGNTTIAALIGAGGLGFFVFRGLEQIAPDLILLGVIPIVLLVLISDKLLSYIIKILTPLSLRG